MNRKVVIYFIKVFLFIALLTIIYSVFNNITGSKSLEGLFLIIGIILGISFYNIPKSTTNKKF